MHDPQFWEQLGRTVATFGFLEETLGKAIFAFTATQIYSASELEAAKSEWLKTCEDALTDTLKQLATSYCKAVKKYHPQISQDLDALIEQIKKAADMRNILCHASWRPPDAEGKSLPFFVSRKLEVVETQMDIAFLRQIQDHVSSLTCDVIESVTQMGFRFPGGDGPGETIWPNSERAD